MDKLLPIGEFSQRSGLTPSRLRSYAANGLLLPAAVDTSSGYRYYSPGQLRDARLIDALRDAGMSLPEIASFLRHPSPAGLDRWTDSIDVDADRRRNALAVARDLLALDTNDTTEIDNTEREDPTPMTTRLHTAARSDVGRARPTNEDAMVSGAELVAVADGMGGAPGGEIASAVAVTLVESAFTGRSSDELAAAVRAANRTIWDRANADSELEGMGTTICAIGLTEPGRIAIVNVGDSRAYLLRDGALQQLTHDHSITAELVRRGELSEDEAAVHPHRSILTRALGVAPTVDLDTSTHTVIAGDRLVVCTDGLYNDTPDTTTLSALIVNGNVDAAADALMEQALSNGGHDNVTVVVADVLT